MHAEVKYTELSIGGKLAVARVTVDQAKMVSMDEESFKVWIKEKLAIDLVRRLINDNLVEFTKNTSSLDYSTTFTARCYLAPDSQVKSLRLANTFNV